MKKILLALILSLSQVHMQSAYINEHEETPIRVAANNEKLDILRPKIKNTVLAVQDILNTLCSALQGTIDRPAADVMCQQLAILSTCAETISQRISEMTEFELARLLDINETLIENIEQHLINEDYEDVGNFNINELFDSSSHKTHFVTVEQIEKKLTHLQEKVEIVYKLIDYLAQQSLESKPSCTTCSAITGFISSHKGSLIMSSFFAGLVYLLRNQNATTIIKEIVARLPIYTLVSLYLLRQKKDGDVKRLVHDTFGKDSYISALLLGVKQYIGSPREKRPAVHIIARADMSADDQIAWAEENECEIIKVDYKKRSIPWLGNFFDLDDSLFKWSFSWIFAQQVRADVLALSKLMGENAEDVVKKILNPGK